MKLPSCELGLPEAGPPEQGSCEQQGMKLLFVLALVALVILPHLSLAFVRLAAAALPIDWLG